MREYEAIIAYLEATGTPHRVTSTVRDPRFPGDRSYHIQGLAVDFAEPTPSRNTPGLLAIFAAFGSVESQLAELAYLGAPYNIKNGRKVRPYDKDNHVHVAVPRGVFLPHPKPAPAPPVVTPMYNPPIIMPDIVASLKAPSGGVWLLGVHGEIYAFECPDWDAPNRHPEYWGNRTAARLESFNGGYTVVDSAGNRYNYPAR